MAEENGKIEFHSDNIFAGQTGIIDYENSVIRGVSLITGGLEAEGHGLTVDDKTLAELQSCAKTRGKVPVQLDHGSGISSTCGYLTGFRVDGNKLRGDMHLLTSHEETPRILERAEKMPDCFGLSVAFKGPPKGVPIGAGKMAARCEKLLSVDLVTRPAANEGLFSVPEKVDRNANGMAQETEGQQNQPIPRPATLDDVMKLVTSLTERLDKQDQFNQDLVQHLSEQAQGQQQPDLTLADLYEMNDEQLAQLGYTRDQVNSAVEEALAEGEQVAAGQEGAAAGAEPATASAGADFSPAGAVGATAMSAVEKRVIRLEQKDRAQTIRRKQDAEIKELSAIDEKVNVLAKQRNDAIEFAERVQAENQALRVAVRTGTRPVAAGVHEGVRMFSANGEGQLHEFQVRVKGLMETEKKSEAEAIRFAQKENPALHADWLESLNKKRVVIQG
jgi:hypothetical protein